jgi:hypothetical protein
MSDNRILKAATFIFIILLIAVMAWLTLVEETDPCANPQADISGAVLADKAGDQDALVNRAIILKGNCEEKPDEH